jgi:hypothetical protein
MLPTYPHGADGNEERFIRQTSAMLEALPRRIRPRSAQLYSLSLGSIALCVVLWIRAKTIGEDERGNAERRALFVGLWPPMLWLMGEAMRRIEEKEKGVGQRLGRARVR